jgi:phosphoglycerol transferase
VPPSPAKFPSVTRASLGRVALLVVVAALVWIAHHDRWTLDSWRVPTDYTGDSHEVLARLKAASEGETWPLLPQVIGRLGAPFGAHWNGYPTPDKPLMLALGALSHLTGVFAAANLGLLLAQVGAAVAFYVTARWLRTRPEWALAGALLFSFTYQTFHRGLAHFSFVFTWSVPLGLLSVWLIAQSRRLHWRSPGALVCLIVALGLGSGNPYLLLFWGQLLLWALLFQWFGPRRRINLQLGLATGALALAIFVACNLEYWIHVQEAEGLPLLVRNYGGTERYALKPVEMFIPPEFHRWDFLAFFGQRYRRWSDWQGEAFLPYLGICGIAGFLWLAGLGVHRLLHRRPLPGQAWSAGWLLAYASVGGITNILAFFAGLQVFRATNRVAVFLSALVLLFLVVRLTRLTAAWKPLPRFAAALALALIGLTDQLPRPVEPARRREIASVVDSDQKFGRALEATLPPGAMIFQLPVLGFPEVVPPFRLTDYEHFRPYLVTDTLRFSYGAAKYRSRSRWQRDLEDASAATLVRELERGGFAALYLNRKGFADQGESLLRELAALGRDRRIESEKGNQVVILLRPDPSPQLPLGQVLTYGAGWQLRPDRGVRWGGDQGTLSWFNPHPRPVRVDLHLELVAPSPRTIAVQLGAQTIGSAQVGSEPVALDLRGVALPPGVNTFRLVSSEPARRQGTGRNQLRAIGLRTTRVTITTPGPE